MTAIIEKKWGFTRCLHAAADLEVWSARVIAGGYSSLHHHRGKLNVIASLTAVLRIEIGNVVRWIAPGQSVTIPAGVLHRFEVMQSGRIIETYRGQCDPADIVRRDSNGWRPPLA